MGVQNKTVNSWWTDFVKGSFVLIKEVVVMMAFTDMIF